MISSFRGEYGFLSNFYESVIFYNGMVFMNAEAAFQAQKSIHPKMRERFCRLNGSQAKKLGRSVSLREDWNEVRIPIMRRILELKFSNPQLKELLLSTGNEELVEGNTWGDKFWGTCNGIGENNLGKLLMEIRESIKNKD